MTIISTKEGQEPVIVSSEVPKKKKSKKVAVEPEIVPEPVPESPMEPPQTSETDKEEEKRQEKQEKATLKAVQKALKEQEVLNKAKEEAIIHAREVLAAEKQQLKDEKKRKREEKKAAKAAIVPENRVKKVKIEEKVEKPVKNKEKDENEPPVWFKSYLASKASAEKPPATTTPLPSPTKPEEPIQKPKPSLVQRRSFDMYAQMFGKGKGVVNL